MSYDQTEHDLREIERRHDLPPEPRGRTVICPECGTGNVTLIGSFLALFRCDRCEHEWEKTQ